MSISLEPLSLSVPLIDLKGDLSEIEVICVYGIGDGAVYRQLRKWLEKGESRFLLFLEDNEELFLKMKGGSWVKDPKVRLLFYQEGQEDVFKEIAWEFLFLKFSFFAQPHYLEEKKEKMIHLFSQIEHYHAGIDLLASDYQDMGVSVLKNILCNQKILASSIMGQSMEGRFANIPAIICGGGSSLQDHLSHLADLKDRALIFAGGSAVTSFANHNLTPHFCAHFDPDPSYQQFFRQEVSQVPHFYQSRFSSALLPFIQGPLLWMAESGNYPIEQWLQEQYHLLVTPFDGGWTVANFCTAIATLLGCNPIIFVGMEFSASTPGSEGTWIEIHDSAGKTMYTKKDWIMSVQWLQEFTQKYHQVHWVNATKVGLDIPYVEKGDLVELSDPCFSQMYDLPGMIHSAIQGAKKIDIADKNIEQVVEELISSYQRCDCACDQLLSQWEKHYPQSPMDTIEYQMELLNLENTTAFKSVLAPLWHVWKRPILRRSGDPLGEHLHRLLFFKRAIEANLRAIS